MSAIINDFANVVLKKLAEQERGIVNALAGGVAANWEAYKHNVGRIEALRGAMVLIKDEARKAGVEDD